MVKDCTTCKYGRDKVCYHTEGCDETFNKWKPSEIALVKEENKKLKELLMQIRNDSKLRVIVKAGGQDKYAGMPPFIRLIDELMRECK